MGLVTLATATALQNLGPLVFGNHALDLQQQFILRILANGMVEENDFYAGALKLVDQQDLVRILAGEPVRRMHVHALDTAQGNRISQPLQGGTQQGRTAVAFVEELTLGWCFTSLSRHAFLKGSHLAGNGLGVGLLLGGNTGIQGRLSGPWTHARLPA